MSKVIPRIFGGIGNQLFCYAAARRLALVNDAELVIDHVSGFVHDHKYKRHYQLDNFNIPCRKANQAECLEPFAKVRRYLKRTYNRYRPFEQRTYIKQEFVDFDSRLLEVKPHGTIYLEGYWQSENYFNDVEQVIRSDLQIKEPVDKINLEMAVRIRKNLSVAIHLRFFDKPNEAFINNAPDVYYISAVEQMEKLIPGAYYFIFSDRPDVARARIPLADKRFTYVSHNCGETNSYLDLWLMSQCQHFIIANSTFSWWGAWLSKNINKQVIAPGFVKRGGRTSWGFNGLLPENWLKL